MKKVFCTSFTCVFSMLLFAHPGIGLVEDSKGNIFYTDLKQVWKITPQGQRLVVVHNVHTHELYLDKNDDLYGENLWYNGEKLDTWGSYAWCLRSNGDLDTVVPPHEGFLTDYSFCRDSAGNQYWAERFTVSRIKKKTPSGAITVLAEGKFKDIRWMHVTSNGVVYFTDQTRIYRIDAKGHLKLLTQNLVEPHADPQQDRHSIFALWLDKQNNLYVAVFSKGVVKKISPSGDASVFVVSTFPWKPVSGVFDRKGDLWLMEYNAVNEVRVKKLTAPQLAVPPAQRHQRLKRSAIPVLLGSSFLLLVCWVVYRFARRYLQF